MLNKPSESKSHSTYLTTYLCCIPYACAIMSQQLTERFHIRHFRNQKKTWPQRLLGLLPIADRRIPSNYPRNNCGTSRPPYCCTKPIKWRPLLCSKRNTWELNLFSPVKKNLSFVPIISLAATHLSGNALLLQSMNIKSEGLCCQNFYRFLVGFKSM